MIRLALAAALVAAPALAQQTTADCARLTRHFVLCDAGTDWASGEWEQFGDGATLHLGDIALDSVEDWAGREFAAMPTVDVALSAMLTDDTRRVVVESHGTDRFDTPHLSVARTIQTESYAGDAPKLRAWMIAATPEHRVMLLLTAPADTPVPQIEARSREIAGLIREVAPE